MKHKHAENMLAYAQDAMETDKPWERWEYKLRHERQWRQVAENPWWHSHVEYRRKPRTININGHKVPEPVITEPLQGQTYYTIDTWGSNLVDDYTWRGDDSDLLSFNRGIIHLTREAAEAHAKALLSFTEKQL